MGSSGSEGSAMDLYKNANECFVSEDYDRSIELYSSSLSQDPSMVQCYAAKAQAYIKKEQYELAKKEADRGFEVMERMSTVETDSGANGFHITQNTIETERKKCLQRSGVASFYLGQYSQAKKTFSRAFECDKKDKGVSQWLIWCDEKIKKFGDQHEATSGSGAGGVSSSQTPPNNVPAESSAVVEAATRVEPVKAIEPQKNQSNEASEKNNTMPTPKIKHDWYQTETHVIIEVRIKGLKADDVKVEFSDVALSISAKLPVGSEYSLEIDLAHPVVPAQSSYRILSTKLEVKIRKKEGVRWNALEGTGSDPIAGGGASQTTSTSGLKAPYSSGRDWNKIEKVLEKETEEKKEGEAALNEMFQNIYKDASDDVKKAMNKSFQESGGTVLSTNWNEIGKEKVDVKPPDGMEYRKWD